MLGKRFTVIFPVLLLYSCLITYVFLTVFQVSLNHDPSSWVLDQLNRSMFSTAEELANISMFAIKNDVSVKKAKLILMWNKIDLKIREGPRHFKNCEYSNCEITLNRSLLSNSDAIILHTFRLKDLPATRFANQTWIAAMQESPLR